MITFTERVASSEGQQNPRTRFESWNSRMASLKQYEFGNEELFPTAIVEAHKRLVADFENPYDRMLKIELVLEQLNRDAYRNTAVISSLMEIANALEQDIALKSGQIEKLFVQLESLAASVRPSTASQTQ